MKSREMKMRDVKKYWNHYREKVKNQPDLYRSRDDLITVVLPKYLLNFSEKRSGHSGYVANCRPLGIRRYLNDSKLALKEIFRSPESLAAFIRSSDADGMVRFETNKSRRNPEVKFSFVQYLNPREQKMLESAASTHATKAWGDKFIFKKLADIYGEDIVRNARTQLTIEEFGLRFGLEMPRGEKRYSPVKNETPARRGVGSY